MINQNEIVRKLKNSIRPLLSVNSVFDTFQGEGRFSGKPVIFVRLNVCHVGCIFCDTKNCWSEIKNNSMLSPLEICDAVSVINTRKGKTWTNTIVISGGEPGEQPYLVDAINSLLDIGYKVIIETSGYVDFTAHKHFRKILVGDTLFITVSPKNLKVKIPVEFIFEVKFLFSSKILYLDSIDGYKLCPNISLQPVEQFGVGSRVSKKFTLYQNCE